MSAWLSESSSLSEVISEMKKKGESMTESEILQIITKVILAIYHSHENGLVHRNVSSTHIMCSKDLQSVKLVSHANIPFK